MLDERYAVVAIGPSDPEKRDALTPAQIDTATRNGVRFLGLRDDVDLLYRGMDVFVLPSHREGYPRAAMEAAASGVPVVATDVRGCRQVVDDGVTGLLVPGPRACRRWRRRSASSARTRVAGAAMGAAAVERARDCFDERRVVATVLDAYRRAAAGSRRWRRRPSRRRRRVPQPVDRRAAAGPRAPSRRAPCARSTACRRCAGSAERARRWGSVRAVRVGPAAARAPPSGTAGGRAPRPPAYRRRPSGRRSRAPPRRRAPR